MKRSWLALVFLGCAVPASAHKPTVTTFTYHDDIYPIFESKCGSCHRAAGVAPMSLLTYKDAFPWAVSIKNEVLHLAMPPWFADERFGAFKHAGGLTAKEMNTIVDWCLGGSPEGEPVGAAADDAGEADDEWSLGAPDALLSMPTHIRLDEATSEHIETVTLEPELVADASLRAIDFRPGAPNVVRSATVLVEGADEPIATWIPGQVPQPMPDGTGHVLRGGTRLVLEVRYQKTWLDDGTAVDDQSTLALYLGAADVAAVETVSVVAGTAHRLDGDAELLALLPRLNARVESLVAELIRPDGSREPLLRLYQPDPGWPRKYWLDTPLAVPKGSRVEVTATAAEGTSPVVLLDLVSE